MSRIWRKTVTGGHEPGFSPRPNRHITASTLQRNPPGFGPTSRTSPLLSRSKSLSSQSGNHGFILRQNATSLHSRGSYHSGDGSKSGSKSNSEISGFILRPKFTPPRPIGDERFTPPRQIGDESHYGPTIESVPDSAPSFGTYEDNLFDVKYTSNDDLYQQGSKQESEYNSVRDGPYGDLRSHMTEGKNLQHFVEESRTFVEESRTIELTHAVYETCPLITRILLVLVILLASSMLFYQIAQSAATYSEYSVDTKSTINDVEKLQFPAITLCNANLLRYDKLSVLYGGDESFANLGLPQIRQMFPSITPGVADKTILVDVAEKYPGNVDMRTFVTKNSHQIEDMLVKCTFDGQPCYANNFTLTLTDYGVCFTYNGKSSSLHQKNINEPGERNGLSLILNTQQNLYLGTPRENVGFKFFPHSPSEVLPNMNDKGAEFQPGTHTSVGLEFTKISKLGSPYGHCSSDQDYSQNLCYLDCQTVYVVNTCSCRTYYMMGGTQFCSPKQVIECVHSALDELKTKQNEVCQCPPPCQQNLIRTTVSQSAFPSLAVPRILQSLNEWRIPALAFGNTVLISSSKSIPTLFAKLEGLLRSLVATQTNDKDVTFLQFTSAEVADNVYTLLLENIFRKIAHELRYSMSAMLFYDVYPHLEEKYKRSIDSGSAFYWEQVNLSSGKYIETLVQWDSLKVGLQDGDAIIDDEYVNFVYEQFQFQAIFFKGFNMTFDVTYDIMRTTAETEVLPTHDLERTTMEYMRDNMIKVDIFYDEMKVVSLDEQVSYVLFQLLSDISNAFVLFFGINFFCYIMFSFCNSRAKKMQFNKQRS